MGASFVVLGLGEIYRPDKGPESWARDEAEERLRMQEEGEDVERLHNYAPGGQVISNSAQFEPSANATRKPRLASSDE